ncbi:MAG: hypothetical protein CFE26_14040 [Verrucomicrobiales bacterium VVV1]|nr:MAG: hypothetical protein CFE26_14040 [Verrucomicrobiales bacterium VVV1]
MWTSPFVVELKISAEYSARQYVQPLANSLRKVRQRTEALHGIVVDPCGAEGLIALEASEVGNDDLALHFGSLV